VRKIAAAAAAIPYIAYVFLQAAVRRLLPGSDVDARTGRHAVGKGSQVSPASSTRVEGGPSVRTGAASLRGSAIDPRRSYGDMTPPPMAVPIRPASADSFATRRSFPTQAYSDEKDLVQSKSQARIPEIDQPQGFDVGPGRIQGAASRPFLGAGVLQVVAVGVSVALLVSALLLGLPAKQVAGGTPASSMPPAPVGCSPR